MCGISYLSNLQPSKGIEDVIQGANLLKRKYDSDFTLNIVGSWRDSLTKDQCCKLLPENDPAVCFHPSCSGAKKFRFLSCADVFVFTPREAEGHPWVIVEALAAGLPIISTDQGTITESVLDGINGFIVNVRSPEQIADRVQLLIEQPELREKFGQASRAHYLQNFTEAKMVKRLSFAIDSVTTS